MYIEAAMLEQFVVFSASCHDDPSLQQSSENTTSQHKDILAKKGLLRLAEKIFDVSTWAGKDRKKLYAS